MFTKKKKDDNPEAQMDLFEHLDELRTRIFYSLGAVVVGMILAYNFSGKIFAFLTAPLQRIMLENGWQFIQLDISQAFLLTLQVSLIAGLILATPFILWQIWAFIRPALTPEEQKPVRYLTPFAALLFFAGLATAYVALPTAYGWMASFVFEDTVVTQNVQQAALISSKIMLSFGLSFELPVLLLFLSRIGILNEKIMKTYWRHALVLIMALSTIITPSTDPLTMLMMGTPMFALYLLSIQLVKWFVPRDDNKAGMTPAMMLLICLAPAGILGGATYWAYLQKSAPLKIKAPSRSKQLPAELATPAPHATPAPTATVTPDDLKALREEIAALRKQVEALKATPTPAPATTPAPSPAPENRGG